MTGDPAYTRAAVKAMTRAVEQEHDFAGWLADVLARVAAVKGSSDALTAGRPGSWEASLCRPARQGHGRLRRRVPAGPGRGIVIVTGDPAEEAERQKRQALHDVERWTARQPEQPGPDRPDKIHVLRVSLHDQPGVDMYLLARWSVIARLCRDAEGSGDQVTDLGTDALLLCQAAQRGQFGVGELLTIGIAKGGRWLRWLPPAPVEPVPGSPGAIAGKN